VARRATSSKTRRIAEDLFKILRAGLPIRPGLTVDVLLALPPVTHQAANRAEGSQITALESVLRRQIAQFETSELRPAASILFGLTATSAGLTLTVRRRLAASKIGYEANHFRKRIERQIIEQLAWQLNKVSDDHADPFMVAPALSVASVRPKQAPADTLSWEVLEHHAVVCRIWSAIYGVRAALATVERELSMEAEPSDVRDAILTTLWEMARLIVSAREYRGSYGDDSPSGPSPHVSLLSRAGWTPFITDPDRDTLTACVSGGQGRGQFVARLCGQAEGSDLLKRWEHEFRHHRSEENE
jgi:hypothetical protein